MTPHQKHQAGGGRLEPLPDALRSALDGSPAAPARRAKQPMHKNGTPAPFVGDRFLSKLQKSVICQLAEAAFECHRRLGLIDDGVSATEWRRSEQLRTIGISSLRECRQAHYLPLRGHFKALAGQAGVSPLADMTAGVDDPDRQTASRALCRELARFAQIPTEDGRETGRPGAEAYLLATIKHKGQTPPKTVAQFLDTWPVARIWAAVYTLRNRIAAKRGVGDTRQRNRSQRKR